MTEMTEDDKNRSVFFGLQGGDRIMSRKNCNAIKWAQTTLIELDLKNQNLSKTVLTLPKSPLLESPDSDEETHQRRRRERLLDELTLICVKHDIKHKEDDSTWSEWGNWSRMDALDILRGIESVKNEQ